jgi:hypothetical protein
MAGSPGDMGFKLSIKPGNGNIASTYGMVPFKDGRCALQVTLEPSMNGIAAWLCLPANLRDVGVDRCPTRS